MAAYGLLHAAMSPSVLCLMAIDARFTVASSAGVVIYD